MARKRTGPLRQMQQDVSALTNDAAGLTQAAQDKLDAVEAEQIREMMLEAREILRKVGNLVDAADSFLEGIDGDGINDYKVITWIKGLWGWAALLITKKLFRR